MGGWGGEQNGVTPTWAAAANGHVKCIDALVRLGADVNKANLASARPVCREWMGELT